MACSCLWGEPVIGQSLCGCDWFRSSIGQSRCGCNWLKSSNLQFCGQAANVDTYLILCAYCIRYEREIDPNPQPPYLKKKKKPTEEEKAEIQALINFQVSDQTSPATVPRTNLRPAQLQPSVTSLVSSSKIQKDRHCFLQLIFNFLPVTDSCTLYSCVMNTLQC